jgi:nucleotide-binding universal stress UspA family protein
MFVEVIAGIDGTANGHDAAILASRLVADGGRLTLVNVHADETVYRYGSEDFAVLARQDSVELLDSEAATLDFPVQHVTFGATSVGEGLHRAAQEHHADLLVVGSSGRGVSGRLLFGDDMRASLDGAPCAVAVAPRGYAEHPSAFASIGVAYDGRSESKAALALARELAHQHGSRIAAVTAVHIPAHAYGAMAAVNWDSVLRDLLSEAQERLDKLRDVDGHTAVGVTTEVVAKFAEDVDLLVVGSRGYGATRRMLFGSTSQYLAHHSSCPLVVLARGVQEPVTSPSQSATTTSP